MKRLSALDRFLLATLVPLWIVAACLHFRLLWEGRFAWVGVFVSTPAADAYPEVRSFGFGFEPPDDGPRLGDRLHAIETDSGAVDLRGVGPVRFTALALEQADSRLDVAIQVERDGAPVRARMQLVPAPFAWRILPFTAALVWTAAVVLWRAPHTRLARPFFVAALALASQWTFFPGGHVAITYVWALYFFVFSSVTLPLALRVAVLFPDDGTAPAPAREAWWPWIFAAGGVTAFAWVFGSPLPQPRGEAATGVLSNAAVVLLLLLPWRNFRRASLVGRRQLMWVLLGLYLGLAPMLVLRSIAVAIPSFWWLLDLSSIFLVFIPLGFLIGIVRVNLFDVDRLLAATTRYSAVWALAFGALVVLIPNVAAAVENVVGNDWKTPARVGTAGALLVAAALAQRWFGPWVERRLLRRAALQEGMPALLRSLVTATDTQALLDGAARGLERLARPQHCEAFILGGSSVSQVFVPLDSDAGPADGAIGAAALGIAALRPGELLDLQGSRRAGRSRQLPGEVAETFTRLHAAVVIPVRRAGSLVAFVVLGPKRDGDVYTSGDLAELEKVGHEIESCLATFDLRRQVPSCVWPILDSTPSDLVVRSREVSVLSAVVVWRPHLPGVARPAEWARLQNEALVRAIAAVQAEGGLLISVQDDQLLAAWNAPQPVEDHAARAVRAALAMRAIAAVPVNGEAADRCAVLAGVHTGMAETGNFATADYLTYDVRGEAVKFAEVLRRLNRGYGTDVLVSKETRIALGRDFTSRFLGRAAVEPTDAVVEINETFGERAADIDGTWRSLEEGFTLALRAYGSGDTADAIERFERLAHEFPGDRPTNLFLSRAYEQKARRESTPPNLGAPIEDAMEPRKHEVFISHATSDRVKAFEICSRLEEEGIACWIAPRDIPPGMFFEESIVYGVERADTVLVLLSQAANESIYVAREVALGTERDKRLIPVRLEDVRAEGRLALHLASLQWVDALEQLSAESLRNIVAALRGSSAADTSRPVPGRSLGA